MNSITYKSIGFRTLWLPMAPVFQYASCTQLYTAHLVFSHNKAVATTFSSGCSDWHPASWQRFLYFSSFSIVLSGPLLSCFVLQNNHVSGLIAQHHYWFTSTATIRTHTEQLLTVDKLKPCVVSNKLWQRQSCKETRLVKSPLNDLQKTGSYRLVKETWRTWRRMLPYYMSRLVQILPGFAQWLFCKLYLWIVQCT